MHEEETRPLDDSGGTPDSLIRTSQAIRACVTVPIEGGLRAEFITFSDLPDGREHIALKMGEVSHDQPPLVRIHSECLTGDVFGSLRCDCGLQIREAISVLSAEGGILLYLRQEGRGIGLTAKIDSYILQDQGLDTYEANEHLNFPRDLRTYEVAAFMLKALGVSTVRLLTNNIQKVAGLQEHGVMVVERLSTSTFRNEHNARYIDAKILKGKHQFKER